MQLAFNLFLTFLGLSLNAYLVSWVANKFDAQTTPEEVLKVIGIPMHMDNYWRLLVGF